VHLNDSPKHDVKENVVPAMEEFPYDSSTTMMILCLPQYSADKIDFWNALLCARDYKVLRLIIIDKVHIYLMHQCSFRDCIHVLKQTFFTKLYRNVCGYSPLFLIMTATMPLSLIVVLEDLTFVKWSLPSHQLQLTAVKFQ
jgi:hypothetical protein